MLTAVVFSVGIFLVLFVSARIGGGLYSELLQGASENALQRGIAKDLAHLKERGDEVAALEEFRALLRANDSDGLIAFLTKEKENRDIGLMGVADTEGIVLGRTKSTGVRGDNVFLTTEIGRAVSRDGYAQSIEVTHGFDPRQMYLTTGRLIREDGASLGALFANYLTDDEYARRFKERYLSSGVEVAFYTFRAGIYGMSVTDPAERALLHSYFHPHSAWVRDGLTGKTIAWRGKIFVVNNIRFPGLEESPGGAFLFIPQKGSSSVAIGGIALLTLLSFFLFALHTHRRTRGEVRGVLYYLLLGATGSVIFIAVSVGVYFESRTIPQLEEPPQSLYNSTIRLQPEFGVYDRGLARTISVIVDAGEEPINAVSFRIRFDPALLEAHEVSPAEGSCSYVIESSVRNDAGHIEFACVLEPSAEDPRSLPVAHIRLTPLRSGVASFSFDAEDTKVLAADGLGTDVLRHARPGSYQIVDTKEEGDGAGSASLVVFSPSHPNQAAWYNRKSARFVWSGATDETYAYTLDTLQNSAPSSRLSVRGNQVSVPIPGDGVYYFHVRPLSSDGPSAHYRIQSDRTPPVILSMQLSDEEIEAGEVVRALFEANDSGSGLQRNWYVDFGNRLFLPTKTGIFIPFLEPGLHPLTLRVYDEAGNYAEQSRFVSVTPKR